MAPSDNVKSSSVHAQQQRESSTARSTARRGFPLGKTTVAIGALASLVYLACQGHASAAPPNAYAVCSTEGNKIYTVDQNNARVACFIVAGKRVYDVGSLGEVAIHVSDEWYELMFPPLSAGIRWRWYTSFVTANHLQGPFQWNLPVHYVPTGSVVVPGISGMSPMT